MEIIGYLVIKSRHEKKSSMSDYAFSKPQLRITKTRPSLAKDEISIKLNLDVPNQLFLKPALEANIKLDDNFTQDISVETVDELSQKLSNALGQEINLFVSAADDN